MSHWVTRPPYLNVHALARVVVLDVIGQTDCFNTFLDSFSAWNFLQFIIRRRRYQGIERALRRFFLLRNGIISKFVSCDWHFRHRSRIYQTRLYEAWCFLRFSQQWSGQPEGKGGDGRSWRHSIIFLTTCILPDPDRAFWCIRRRRQELRRGKKALQRESMGRKGRRAFVVLGGTEEVPPILVAYTVHDRVICPFNDGRE